MHGHGGYEARGSQEPATVADPSKGRALAADPPASRRRLTWCARLLAVPAAVGTLVLASCGALGGASPAAAPADPKAPATDAAAPSASAATGAADPSVSPSTSPVPSPRVSRSPSTRPRPTSTAVAGRRPSVPKGKRTPPFPMPRPTPQRTLPPAPGPAVEAAGLTSAEAEVLRLVNVQRASHGCGPLTSNPILVAVARAHSADMAAKGYFDHTSPDGRSPFDRMRDAGYRGGLMGENIAAGQPTAAAVMDAWMTSPGHRANILNCGYHAIGVGVANRSGSTYGIYWTQDFGDR